MSAAPPAGSGPAVDAAARPPPAGWFGKIPALGDFVSRRLPPEFIEPWDEWLSEELFAAREKLDENWLESYLKAPIWRFALMPGVLDARHWFGVLMPSVDRVGRQFPLTFAASFEPDLGTLNGWWSTLIGVALRAKESSCDADALEAALVGSPDNQVPDQGAEPIEGRVAPALAAAATGTSLWWSWQTDAPGAETLAVLQGMPRGDRFLELIDPGLAGTRDSPRDSPVPTDPSIVRSTDRSAYVRYAYYIYIVLLAGGVSFAWWMTRPPSR
jgi:type VI secretion system protein ImpM